MANLSEEQFIELVQKAERDAAQNINAYKFKLALFAILGYVVIFSVLTTLVLLVGGTLGIALISTSVFLLLIKKKFIFIILAAIWVFLKALWVKFDPPTGYLLDRKDYPELYAEIDELTRTLKSLKIDQVFLDDRLNAAVVQHPKFGVLGGQKNTLFLGLQLLLALSPQEMRSVLAHEFGHLSGNHSRFSGWIYRIRLSWHRIMLAFEESSSFGASIMRRFFNWYAPKFSAYSFALARNNEYEADEIAAELTSSETAAKALVNVYVSAPYIDQNYWDSFIKKADELPQPPNKPFEGLANFIKSSPIARDDLIARINQELEEKTHYADTHPSLRDRVRSITSEFVIPDTSDKNAAEVLLGERYQAVLKHFDDEWLDANKQRWQNRYEYVKNAQQSLAQFKSQPLEELSDDALWDFAQWTREFDTDEAAHPLFMAFHERHQDSIGAAYYIGKFLLRNENKEGLAFLRLTFKSHNLLEEAAHLGYQFLKQHENEKAAESWWQEAMTANAYHQSVYDEQESLTEEHDFKHPQLDKELLDELKAQLKQHKNVGSVWLAEKILEVDPSRPVYAVSFRPKGFYWSFESVQKNVADTLKLDMNVFVVCLWGDARDLAKKIKKQGIKLN
jgi:Zn-dependent protease with chaperone function